VWFHFYHIKLHPKHSDISLDIEVYPVGAKSKPKFWKDKQAKLHTTQSGKIVKNKAHYSNQELKERFGYQSKKQRRRTRELLKRGKSSFEGDYA